MPNNFIEIELEFDKKGKLNKFIKKLSDLMLYNVTVGIHKEDGVNKVKGSFINIATLSNILEIGTSWIQPFTKLIPKNNGDGYVVIPKGSRVNIPGWWFINLQNIPYVWNKIKIYIRNLCINFMSIDNYYIKSSLSFWKQIGKNIELNQKERIDNNYPPANSEVTQLIKGFNNPLKDTGLLRSLIKFKINKEFNINQKKILKLKYITNLQKIIGNK